MTPPEPLLGRSFSIFVSLVLAQLFKLNGNQKEVLYKLKGSIFFKFLNQYAISFLLGSEVSLS